MDTWIRLGMFDNGAERNRGLSIIKSRGMAHSNQIREFLITDHGIEILDAYLGQAGGRLMGTTRAAQEAKDKAQDLASQQETERMRIELENDMKSLDAQINTLRSEFNRKEEALDKINKDEKLRHETVDESRIEMARLRKSDSLTED